MFKVSSKDTRMTPHDIVTSLLICKANQLTGFYMMRRCSGVFIVNFEQISNLALVFLLLTLNMGSLET